MILRAPSALIARRDWRSALAGLARLGRDNGDLDAVMTVLQSLDGPAFMRAFGSMARSQSGRPQLEAQVELCPLLADPAWLRGFAPGTLGATYRGFMARRPAISARGMADCLVNGPCGATIARPLAAPWFARRIADLHDVLHVLTGYAPDDALGEGCIVAFTYAQLGSLGYLLIALGAALTSARPAAVLEAWRAGCRASWVFDIDPVAAFAEPLDQVRLRLNIRAPRYYRSRVPFE